MKVTVEIRRTALIFDPVKIADLDEKRLVPKMMLRRRLTRASKIAVYLADRCGFESGPIVYGSTFGELQATVDIVGAIADKEAISPTAFQNSVYNTAPSYLSILKGDRSEILTLSSGRDTSADVLSTGALQALVHGAEVLLLCTETMDIPDIESVNRCSDYLEMGMACTIALTDRKADLKVTSGEHGGFPPSVHAMLDLIKACEGRENPVVTLEL
jgi:hypothetical protein